ncbi:MAG: carboxypeptidase-like regulatory domain-containing protein [Bryobacteraceae bacterium]|jgi:hypothetical protein
MLAVLVALGLMAQVAPRSNEAMYPVTGTVTDSVTGRPLARVRVALSLVEGGDPHYSLVTGADGRFSFRAPAGRYHLVGERAGYRRQMLNDSVNYSTAVLVGPGKVPSELAFRLHPGAAISGHVLDDNNEPVDEARVAVYRVGTFQGRRRALPLKWTFTDGTGEYRAGDLPAGAYYVMAVAQPWFMKEVATGVTVQGGDVGIGWPNVYSGNTVDPRSAALISLAEGGEATADLSFVATRGARLKLHADSGKPGEANVLMLQYGLNGQKTMYRNENVDVGADGCIIANVYPGTYDLMIRWPGHDGYLYRTVSVSSGDMDVDLSDSQMPKVSGQVRVESTGAGPEVPLQVMFFDEALGGAVPAITNADGTFAASLVAGGPYRVSVTGGKYMVRSVTAAGAKANGAVIESLEGGPVKVTIVVTDDVAHIEGMLRRGTQALPGAAVMLIPRNGEATAAEDQTDSDGSFNLRELPLGDYDLLILETGEHIEYAQPEVLAQYRDRFRPVHVAARGVQKLEIDLDEPAARPEPPGQ